MLTAVALMLVGALLVFQRLETTMRVLVPFGQIRKLRCFICCTNQRTASGCQAGRLNPPKHDLPQLLLMQVRLHPDFLPLGIGLFIMNTRDVVTCEDAQKAVETYFYSFQAIPPSNKACLWAVLQQFQDHWYPQFKSNGSRKESLFISHAFPFSTSTPA